MAHIFVSMELETLVMHEHVLIIMITEMVLKIVQVGGPFELSSLLKARKKFIEIKRGNT